MSAGGGRQRASTESVALLKTGVTEAVRRRVQRPPVYMPPQLTALETHQKSDTPDQKSDLAGNFVSTFESLVWEGAEDGAQADRHLQQLSALELVDRVVSSSACPPTEMLVSLVHKLMMGEQVDVAVRRRCLRVLRQMAFLHPPHMRKLRNLYLYGLADKDTVFSLLKRTVDKCQSSHNSPDFLVYTEFLDLVVSLLEEDITVCANRLEPMQQLLGRSWARPLLARVLWRDGDLVMPNQLTGQLADWVSDAFSGRQDSRDFTLCRLLLRLLTMTAELVRVASQNTFLTVTEDMKKLAMQLCRSVSYKDMSACVLEELLCSVRPAWLVAWLSASLLEKRHARPRPPAISLARLDRQYLQPEPAADPPPDIAAQPLGETQVRPKQLQQSPMSSPAKKKSKTDKDINKTDKDGRTRLHRACLADDAEAASVCLREPSLQVNAADLAGRSALHLAAGAGSLACLRLLLTHRPANLLRYFSPKRGGASRDELDPSRRSADGRSPFHAAVAAGQVEAARLLLQHLGPGALTEPTGAGQTPAELAPSAEMRRLVSPRAAEPPPAATPEYSLLVYHLLVAHLLDRGLAEARVVMAVTRAADPEAAPPLPAASAAVCKQVTAEMLLEYRADLSWLQDRPGRADTVDRLHPRYRRLVRAVIKL